MFLPWVTGQSLLWVVGVRFVVTQCHPMGPRMDSLNSLCRTSYWPSIETMGPIFETS